jgi:hypothetical protein
MKGENTRMLLSGDEYRRQAEECRAKAESASRPEHKAQWLKLAQEYLSLAESADNFRSKPLPSSEKLGPNDP